MASKTVVTLVDDLDGSADDVNTVELTFEGVQYEVDLSAANQQALSDALARYLDAARKTGGRRRRGSALQTTTVSADSNTVRTWAQANGYKVSPRGRISGEVRDAFEAAH